ncbi:MAG TPA: heme ABC exporter ATP-binding protein CcmA [Gammaproteobacteria bacterium]
MLQTSAVLRGESLEVWRGERCLFEGLDFELASGGLAVVVGPNGAGKTTLLRTLAGLAPPTAGRATWGGTDVRSLSPDARGQIAYRGHLDALKRELTVVENLEFYRALAPRAAPLEPLLDELALAHVADVRARYLSAGQRRRTGLAALRLAGAKLWLLDEPTTNLDAAGRQLLADWVRRHLDEGGLAVIATHQPDLFAGRPAVVIEL